MLQLSTIKYTILVLTHSIIVIREQKVLSFHLVVLVSGIFAPPSYVTE